MPKGARRLNANRSEHMLMQRETIRYAKRQGTWFAREPEIHWLEVSTSMDAETVARVMERRLEDWRLS